MTPGNLRLLLVEPLQINASLWLRLLEQEVFFTKLDTARDTRTALEVADQYDMIVLGTSLDHFDALALVQQVATSLPEVRLVVAGVPRSEAAVLRTIEAGALGVILRDETVDAALETMLSVAGGDSRIDPELAPELMEHLTRLRQSSLDPDTQGRRYSALTDREREVLELIGREMSNREIAESLSIEVGTVKNHVHSILGKLELGNRHMAARYLRSLDPVTAGQPNPEN